MGLNIKNSETEAVIRSLAALTGEKLTEAIHHAVEEKLDRLRRQAGQVPLTEYLAQLGALQDALAARTRTEDTGP